MTLRSVGIVLGAVVVSACGGGSPSGPSSQPTPVPTPTASKSVLALGASNATLTVEVSTNTLKCGLYHADWVVAESAGLSARIVRSDVYLRDASGGITGRMVIDRPDPIPALGKYEFQTNRDACGDPRRHFPMVMVVRLDITDARENAHVLTGEVGFTER